MDKTAVVVASHLQKHEKLHAYIRRRHKHYCHDEHNETRTGDLVHFTPSPTRISKTKSFIITKIVKKFRAGIDPIVPVEQQPPTLIPERALQPQHYLPQDLFCDDFTAHAATAVSNPYIDTKSSAGPRTKGADTATRSHKPPRFYPRYGSLNTLADQDVFAKARQEYDAKYPGSAINKCDDVADSGSRL
uniref:30S ribosomal protein S17 n=1 Tax=Lygus hesperus TaxID=30085 RepID=A0A0A9Z9Z3_LYGHE